MSLNSLRFPFLYFVAWDKRLQGPCVASFAISVCPVTRLIPLLSVWLFWMLKCVLNGQLTIGFETQPSPGCVVIILACFAVAVSYKLMQKTPICPSLALLPLSPRVLKEERRERERERRRGASTHISFSHLVAGRWMMFKSDYKSDACEGEL